MTVNKKTIPTNVSEQIDINHKTVTTYSLSPDGMSRAKQLLQILPFSKSTLWLWSRDGRFPEPIKLSNTITAWRNSDVIAWLENWVSEESGPDDSNNTEGKV